MFTITTISEAEFSQIIDCIKPISIECTLGYWTNKDHQIDVIQKGVDLSLMFKTSIKANANNAEIDILDLVVMYPDGEYELEEIQAEQIIEIIKNHISIEL